jgi:hypothetical protein
VLFVLVNPQNRTRVRSGVRGRSVKPIRVLRRVRNEGRPLRQNVAAILALSVTLSAWACGGNDEPPLTATLGPRPSSTATLSIVAPTNGQVVHGASTKLKTRLEGARIVAPTSTNLRPDEGHLHVRLDGQFVSMVAKLKTRLTDLTPGPHLLEVEFVAGDHSPFEPRVIDKVSFEVAE